MSEFGMPFDMPENPVDPEVYRFSAVEERMRIGAEMTDGVIPTMRTVTTDATAPEVVLGNALAVTAGTGLNVTLAPGIAICGSTYYFNTANKIFSAPAGVTTDIVVQLDLANAVITTERKTRTSGADIEDDLTRSATIWQICLASITVPAGTTQVTSAMITDQRLNTTACSTSDGHPVCGLVGSALQLSSEMILDEWDNIKGQLAEDPAGHLQLEIGDLDDLTTTAKNNLVAAINELVTNAGKLEIQYGTVTTTSSGDTAITFETAFSGVPVVLVSQDTSVVPSTSGDFLVCGAYGATTQGCTVYSRSLGNPNTKKATTVAWVAVYKGE